MIDAQIELIKHYQNMQREFHDASVRAMELHYLSAARVFQHDAALCYETIERLTTWKPRR